MSLPCVIDCLRRRRRHHRRRHVGGLNYAWTQTAVRIAVCVGLATFISISISTSTSICDCIEWEGECIPLFLTWPALCICKPMRLRLGKFKNLWGFEINATNTCSRTPSPLLYTPFFTFPLCRDVVRVEVKVGAAVEVGVPSRFGCIKFV